MTFAKQVQELSGNLENLLSLQKVLVPGNMDAINKIINTDMNEIKSAKVSVDKIRKSKKNISAVSNQIESVVKVANMNENILLLVNKFENIDIVANNLNDIQTIKELSPSIIKCNGLEPTLKDVLTMKNDIGMVLDNKDKIEDINQTVTGMQDALSQMEDMYLKSSAMLADIKKVESKIERKAKAVADSLNEIKTIQNQLHTFQVKTFIIDPERKGYSKYEPTSNILNLFIPRGNKGDRGNDAEGRRGQRGLPGTAVEKGETGDPGRPGRNGKDFNVNIFGMKKEMSIYGNRPIGTSFLSLDEEPSMIYFRNSNTLDSWTKGQPFGISEGEEVNIKVLDSNKLGGFTIEDIYSNIENQLNKIINKGDKDA